jgi:hypothetical protein
LSIGHFEGWITARPPARRTGSNAVMDPPGGLCGGGGPRAGHNVTVFERSDRRTVAGWHLEFAGKAISNAASR